MLKKNPHDSFPHDLNVDLHMHSSASDGALAPEAVITRAH